MKSLAYVLGPQTLLDAAPVLGADLEKFNYYFLAEKASRILVPRYQERIFKLNRISDKGTVQLSIDTDAIKRVLLEFPKVSRHALTLTRRAPLIGVGDLAH